MGNLVRRLSFVGYLIGFVVVVLYAFHWRYYDIMRYGLEYGPIIRQVRHLSDRTLGKLGYFRFVGKNSFVHFPKEKKQGVFRIGCFGDSYTFGEEVDEEFTYPMFLQRLLDSKNVEVINFGHSWYGLAQTYIMWEEVGKQFDLDLLIVGPIHIDPLRDLSFNHTFGNYPSFIHGRYLVDDGKLRYIEVPGKTTEERFENFYSFIPHRYFRYDFLAPAFIQALSQRKHRMNPLYYNDRPHQEEILELYSSILPKMAKTTPLLFISRDPHVARRIHEIGVKSLLYRQPVHFPYKAINGHNTAIVNKMFATLVLNAMKGIRRDFTFLRMQDLPVEDTVNTKIFNHMHHQLWLGDLLVASYYVESPGETKFILADALESSFLDAQMIELDFVPKNGAPVTTIVKGQKIILGQVTYMGDFGLGKIAWRHDFRAVIAGVNHQEFSWIPLLVDHRNVGTLNTAIERAEVELDIQYKYYKTRFVIREDLLLDVSEIADHEKLYWVIPNTNFRLAVAKTKKYLVHDRKLVKPFDERQISVP